MGAADQMLRGWGRTVKGLLAAAGLHGHVLNALSVMSFAAAAAGHCQGGRIAAHAPGRATLASHRRGFERLLANRRLGGAGAAMAALAAGVLGAWAGRPVTLILD